MNIYQDNINGYVQDWDISNVLAMEILQSWPKLLVAMLGYENISCSKDN